MKKMRGFTLIECLIALAVLGVASLVMAQIYANVSKINRANHQNNSSIAYQMKYVENKTDTEAMRVKAGYTPPATPATNGEVPPINSSTIKNITLTRKDPATGAVISVYGYAVDYYVLQTRDQNDEAAYTYNAATDSWSVNPDYNNIYKTPASGVTANNYDYVLNYKYFKGYSN